MNEWMNDEWMKLQLDEWNYNWMNELTIERMNEWMNEWMNEIFNAFVTQPYF